MLNQLVMDSSGCRCSWSILSIRFWDSNMPTKRLQGCSILLLVFLLSSASGGAPETSVQASVAAAILPEASFGGGGGRRSLATGGGMFCVAVQSADPAALQAGLNWACGPGHADCAAIQPGGACYKQNNVVALASYAYNDYYHRNANSGATCSFNGTAMTTTTDPSSGQCIFAGSSMAGGSTTPAASAPTGLTPPSSFTPGFGNGSSSNFGSPTSVLNPLDGADGALAGARRALCLLLLLLPPLFFL